MAPGHALVWDERLKSLEFVYYGGGCVKLIFIVVGRCSICPTEYLNLSPLSFQSSLGVLMKTLGSASKDWLIVHTYS